MTTKSLCWVLASALVALSLLSCERLPEAGAQPLPAKDFRALVDSVPRSYGRLVAVGPAGRNVSTVSLWFEANDQTLTAVRVNTSTGAISKEVVTVPRQ